MQSCRSKITPCTLDIRVLESSWFYFSFMFECKFDILECEGLMAPASTSNNCSRLLCAILTSVLLI